MTIPAFNFAPEPEERRHSTFFDAKALPEERRKQLCIDLLAEFGVTRYTERTGRGELVHSCPIPDAHPSGDRHPSAQLNYRDLVFTCWSCGYWSGLLDFIAACRGETATGARKWLDKAAGLGGELLDLETIRKMIEAAYARPGAREPLPGYDERVLEPWLRWPIPHPYLTEPPAAGGRGIPEQTCRTFKLGYAPDYEMRTDEGVVRQERIIIPHYVDGRLVGWQARKIAGSDHPKFKSTPAFPKDRTLFNHARRRRFIVVESPMTILRHAHHVPELVATFGATVTENQMRLLRSADEIVTWFDNDEAGWTGTRKLIEALSAHTDVRCVRSDFDADMADFPDDQVEEMVDRAVSWPLWKPPSELRELN